MKFHIEKMDDVYKNETAEFEEDGDMIENSTGNLTGNGNETTLDSYNQT